MSVHHTHSKPCPKSSITRPKLFAPEVCSRVSKNAEKYIRSHGVLKDDKTQVMSHSESKIYQRNPSHWIQSAQLNKSDSKVPSGRTKQVVLDKVNPLKAGGDCKPHMRSSTEVPKRRITPPKPNLYQSFNSYNKTHGIITPDYVNLQISIIGSNAVFVSPLFLHITRVFLLIYNIHFMYCVLGINT